jgi:hypothetical protein
MTYWLTICLFIYFIYVKTVRKSTFAYFRESVRQSCRYFHVLTEVIFEYMRRPRNVLFNPIDGWHSRICISNLASENKFNPVRIFTKLSKTTSCVYYMHICTIFISIRIKVCSTFRSTLFLKRERHGIWELLMTASSFLFVSCCCSNPGWE